MQLDDLIERLDESITVYDRDARLLFVNEAACIAVGRPREELLGQRVWEVVGSRGRSPFRDALEGVLAGGPKCSVTYEIPRLARWFEVDVYPHPEGAMAVARDITQRQHAQARLRESEARFRAMVEFAPEAILIFDVGTGRFTDTNAEAENLFGRSREEMLTLGPAELSPVRQPDGASSAELLPQIISELVRTGAADLEWTVLGPRGQTVLVEVHVRRLPFTDPPQFRASIQDITKRRRAQEQLAQVQRLEAVARLAGGVAHDFNNMLTIILGGTQLAIRDLDSSESPRELLLSVVDAAERASLVTRQLLAFARDQKTSPRVLNLSEYAERMKPMLARIVGEDIEMELDLARPLGDVLIDPGHVEQILLNLAANARDAMPGGGTLTIHTANVFLDTDYQRLHNGVPPGRYVMLTVADTGEGIPDAVKPHIFEPFFTTKALHRGTGLGLATVHGLVTQNRGHIWVYSEAGMGATFKIYLPIADGTGKALEDAPAREKDELRGTETILLVEDEDGVRQFLRRALQRSGYTVLEARNAGEALLIFEQHETPIKAMITDVVMPRMTGPELAARLRKVRPELRIVFISGYSEDRIPLTEDGTAHDAFIAKPLSVDALLRGVRGVLDRKP